MYRQDNIKHEHQSEARRRDSQASRVARHFSCILICVDHIACLQEVRGIKHVPKQHHRDTIAPQASHGPHIMPNGIALERPSAASCIMQKLRPSSNNSVAPFPSAPSNMQLLKSRSTGSFLFRLPGEHLHTTCASLDFKLVH